MTDFRRVTDSFYVAAQIVETDIPAAAAQGFTTLIVNRPDGEDPGQMSHAVAQAAAERAGLAFLAIPISGPPNTDAIDRTAEAIAATPGPILAFCRSGTRSVTLWAFAAARSGSLTATEILAAAKGAGYDLSAHTSALESSRA